MYKITCHHTIFTPFICKMLIGIKVGAIHCKNLRSHPYLGQMSGIVWVIVSKCKEKLWGHWDIYWWEGFPKPGIRADQTHEGLGKGSLSLTAINWPSMLTGMGEWLWGQLLLALKKSMSAMLDVECWKLGGGFNCAFLGCIGLAISMSSSPLSLELFHALLWMLACIFFPAVRPFFLLWNTGFCFFVRGKKNLVGK